jgi:hypothetical protein
MSARAYTCTLLVCLSLLIGLTCFASELQFDGGMLEVNSRIRADEAVLGADTLLRGAGVLDAPVQLHGDVAPGSADPADVAILSFGSNLTFHVGSRFLCSIADNTALDRLSVAGMAAGTGQVDTIAVPGAIPLDQVIIDGGSGSAYAGLSISADWSLASGAGDNLLLTDLTGDTDSNSIPDYWEDEYFGGRTNCDAAADNDQDLMVNWDEYIAGTVPTNALSRLFMTPSAQASLTNCTVTWSSVADRRYTLLRGTNLRSGAFVPVVSNITATPPANTYTDSVVSLDVLYYRILVEQNN